MDMTGLNVQFQIEDEDVAEQLLLKAVRLKRFLNPKGKLGGATLAKAIVEAAVRSGRVNEILGIENGPEGDGNKPVPKTASRR